MARKRGKGGSMKGVLGLMAGEPPNPIHRALFGSVCASVSTLALPRPGSAFYPVQRAAHLFTSFHRKELYSADVALSESVYEYPALFKKLLKRNLKVVELFASPKIFKVLNNETDPGTRAMMKGLIREVDGFLPVSRMCADFLKEKGIGKPVEIVHPFIPEAKYKALLKSGADAARGLDEKTEPSKRKIACIGYPPEYKGMDFLLKVFDSLCGRGHDDLELRLVTKPLPQRMLSKVRHRDRVVVGPIAGDESYCREVAGATMSMHFGRYDTFPVSTLETMLAGVPTFVSGWTGTKELAGSVDRRFVLDFDVEAGVEAAEWLLSLDGSRRKAISAKFHRAAMPFSRERQVGDFQEKFARLLRRI